MNFIYTMNVVYKIDSQASLCNLFKLIESKAYDKKLLLYCSDKEFYLVKVGSKCSDEPIFKTEFLDAIIQFVEQWESV
jgi:hypothetical protein